MFLEPAAARTHALKPCVISLAPTRRSEAHIIGFA